MSSVLLRASAAVLVAVASGGTAAGAGEPAVSIELVVLGIPSPADELEALPLPQAEIELGEPCYVELWARTIDPRGLAQVTVDILFDASLASVIGITHTPLFDLFPHGMIDNVSGIVDELSGSHAPGGSGCSDEVGVAGWARVAVMEMSANAPGTLTIQSTDADSMVYFVGVCGSLEEPTVAYGAAEVAIGAGVPALRVRGSWAMLLFLAVAGILVLHRRQPTTRQQLRSS